MGLDPSGKHNLPSFPFFSTSSTTSLAQENSSSHVNQAPKAESSLEPEEETPHVLHQNNLSPFSLTSPPQFPDTKEIKKDPLSIMMRTAQVMATHSTMRTATHNSTEANQSKPLSFGNFSSEEDSDRSSSLIPDPGQAAAAARSSWEPTLENIVRAAQGQAPLYPSSPDSVLSTCKGLHKDLNQHKSQASLVAPGHSITQTVVAGATSREITQVPPHHHLPVRSNSNPLGIMVSEYNMPSTCSTDFSTDASSLAEQNYSSSWNNSTCIELAHSESSSGLYRNDALFNCNDSDSGYFNKSISGESLRGGAAAATTVLDSAAAAAPADQDPYYTLMANLSSLKYTNTDQISSMSCSGSSHCGGYSSPLENLFSPFPDYTPNSDDLRHEMHASLLGDHAWVGNLQPSHSSMAFLSNDDSLWEPCIMWLTRERYGDTDRDTEKSSSIAAEGKWNHTATEEIH